MLGIARVRLLNSTNKHNNSSSRRRLSLVSSGLTRSVLHENFVGNKRSIVTLAQSGDKKSIQVNQLHYYTISRLNESYSTWSWWNSKVPNGFEKFFKGDKGKSQDTEKEFSSSNSTNSSKNGGSGGGKKGTGGDSSNDNSEIIRSLLLALVVGVLAFTMGDMKNGKEISWQDFQKHLLETGLVDRIVVVNKNIARYRSLRIDLIQSRKQ